MSLRRRRFLSQSAAVTAGFAGLSRFLSHPVRAAGTPGSRYGHLRQDPQRLFDLPVGFKYHVIGRAGDFMDDGFRMPGRADGMAAFPGPDGTTVLVRNHELEPVRTYEGPFGIQNELFGKVDQSLVYDPGQGVTPHVGGTSNVVYDPRSKEVHRQFLSLVGTSRNCAGGPTPWNTWITCEEAVERKGGTDGADPDNRNEQDHGYNFEVPASTEPGLHPPVPLLAMGRFNHEAVAVDPTTGIVYQTEDRHDGVFYRFIPAVPGKLTEGGRLQVMAVDAPTAAGGPKGSGVDTRNWPDGATRFPTVEERPVRWIDIDGVDAPDDDLRKRGYKMGAARFARAEGIWHGRDGIYFACTNGGTKQYGQIFRYRPSPAEGTDAESEKPGTLELFIEPNNKKLLQGADNLTVANWGDVIVVEDGPRHAMVRGITPDGEIYPIGRNAYNDSELAGVCFSPDGSTLFVNIYTPGITLAITGPWNRTTAATK